MFSELLDMVRNQEVVQFTSAAVPVLIDFRKEELVLVDGGAAYKLFLTPKGEGWDFRKL